MYDTHDCQDLGANTYSKLIEGFSSITDSVYGTAPMTQADAYRRASPRDEEALVSFASPRQLTQPLRTNFSTSR